MKSLQDLSFPDYLRIIRRRIWWVIVPAFLVGAGAFAYVRSMPSLYRSETTIMVSNRLLPEDYIGSLVRDTAGDRIEFVRQQLQSRSFVERIVQESQAGNGRQDNTEGLVNSILGSTEVTMVSPGTFKVAFISSSPDQAQVVTRRLAEGVMTLNKTLRKSQVDAADKFLEEEVRRAANDVTAAEAAVRQFNRNNFPSISDQQGVSMEVLNNFERQLASVDANLENLTSQRKFLAGRIEDQRQVVRMLQNLPAPVRPAEPAPQPVTDSPYIPTESEKALASKQAELRAATSRYTPLHPDVVRLTREVRELEAQVSAQPRLPKGSTPPAQKAASQPAVSLPPLDPSDDLTQAESELELEQLDQRIAKQQQAKSELDGKISMLHTRLNLPPALAQQLTSLTRDVEDAKQRYNVLTTKKMNSELAASVDTNVNNALFKIVDPANYPKRPFSPNRQLYLALGCLMGLGTGLGLGFLREFADSTFADEDELSSQLKMPVLASIPTVISPKAGDAGAANKRTLTLIPSALETNDAATFSLRAADGKLKYVIFNPMTIAGEQYRLIRTSLSTMQKQHGMKCLLITSTIPGEGKSFVAACLAGILAQEAGKSVLLIQADIRTINGSKLLGVHQRERLVGLSEILQGSAGTDETLLKCEELNLYLLPCGKPVHNAADLLSKPEFENLLRDFSQRFDWIIIDSPPILALSDASLIAASTDATLMVVRAEKTPASLVKDSVQRIGRDRICGVVLNGARRIKASYYYGQYHQQTIPVKKI